MERYVRPDGTLVLDFTPPPDAEKAVQVRVQCRRCSDCGGVCDGRVAAGRHAPHAVNGKTVNCVGAVIEDWP